MFAADSHTQDLWTGDDGQGGSLVSNYSGQTRSDFDNFTTEGAEGTVAKQNEDVPSTGIEYKGSKKIPEVLRTGDAALLRNGQMTLPPEKAFPIQIGWRLFRLSGASIMSDGKLIRKPQVWMFVKIPRAPSYFSTYFEEQIRLEESGSEGLKTLFIDRDPDTFADICRHLQGKSVLISWCLSMLMGKQVTGFFLGIMRTMSDSTPMHTFTASTVLYPSFSNQRSSSQ